MRKSLFALAAAFSFFVLSLFIPCESSAVPAFSRQTGMACNSCHFQHFPTLNSFGRAFKSGGYTMTGGQSMIEGDFLSLPSVLNASFVTKVRYQKRDGDSNHPDATAEDQELNKGQLQFPDEAALLLGGRVGEHAGFLLEASLKDGDSRFTSFKIPFVYVTEAVNLNVIPFTTDGFGPAYGLELLNTGALRLQRPIEHRTEISAQQYIGAATAATGITLAAAHQLWFANYTLWSNEHSPEISSGPYLHYGRIAFTPAFEGWDLGIGAQIWAGKEANLSADPDDETAVIVTRKEADAWAVDAQAQGTVGAFPLGVYLTYARAAKSNGLPGEGGNIFNENQDKARKAWTALAEVGVVPGKLTAAAAYRHGRSGSTGDDEDNATTLGLVYTPLQNIQFQLDSTWYSGSGGPGPESGDNLTTLMLFAAF
ncbi:MAG: hypothetical protein K8I01_12585 [Candidatus Methylomirabilis sp.]|nr:hypothetical protein [Deltaproteobacteria bacterium]